MPVRQTCLSSTRSFGPRGHHYIQLANQCAPVRRARDQIRRALAGISPRTAVDDAALVVSELVTNAIRHTADGPSHMVVDLLDVEAWVWVYDGSPETRRLRTPARRTAADGCMAEQGRGMQLIDALSRKWFVLPAPAGKVVVAVLGLTG